MKIILEKDLVPGKIYRILGKFKFIGFGLDNQNRKTIKKICFSNPDRLLEEDVINPDDPWHYYSEDQLKFGR